MHSTHMTSLADQIAPHLIPPFILHMFPLQDPLKSFDRRQPDIYEIVLHAPREQLRYVPRFERDGFLRGRGTEREGKEDGGVVDDELVD
jgi:hypothetical protein